MHFWKKMHFCCPVNYWEGSKCYFCLFEVQKRMVSQWCPNIDWWRKEYIIWILFRGIPLCSFYCFLSGITIIDWKAACVELKLGLLSLQDCKLFKNKKHVLSISIFLHLNLKLGEIKLFSSVRKKYKHFPKSHQNILTYMLICFIYTISLTEFVEKKVLCYCLLFSWLE